MVEDRSYLALREVIEVLAQEFRSKARQGFGELRRAGGRCQWLPGLREHRTRARALRPSA